MILWLVCCMVFEQLGLLGHFLFLDHKLKPIYYIHSDSFSEDCKQFYTLFAECFWQQILSMGLWPSGLPDLNPCDFYLWGKLEEELHSNNQHTDPIHMVGFRMQCLLLHQPNFPVQSSCSLDVTCLCKLKASTSSTFLKYDKEKSNINCNALK